MVTKLDRELEQLGSMTRDELIDRWQAAYGCPPPAGARRELLLYAAGWHIQVKRLGGLPGEVRRMLRREVDRIRRDCQTDAGSASTCGDPIFSREEVHSLGDPASSSADRRVERRKLSPGTRLLRDWNGRTHAVDVTAAGYLYEGGTYRSLSAIARKITGAHWSGPRFFGL